MHRGEERKEMGEDMTVNGKGIKGEELELISKREMEKRRNGKGKKKKGRKVGEAGK